VTEIAMAVEEEFHIAIEDHELESLITIADVASAVERKLGSTLVPG
jgi:acyl carrier protein